LREASKSAWFRYRETLQPLSVNKIGLRYINRIEIPFPVKELRDYCLLFPEFPLKMPQTIGNFFMQFQSVNQEIGATGVVTLAVEPMAPGQQFVALIFDIDVGCSTGSMHPDAEEIWTKFELLRNFKNRIFHSNLTENAKKLFR
jgi:uncharacterized protein (TIGR04255 family)